MSSYFILIILVKLFHLYLVGVVAHYGLGEQRFDSCKTFSSQNVDIDSEAYTLNRYRGTFLGDKAAGT